LSAYRLDGHLFHLGQRRLCHYGGSRARHCCTSAGVRGPLFSVIHFKRPECIDLYFGPWQLAREIEKVRKLNVLRVVARSHSTLSRTPNCPSSNLVWGHFLTTRQQQTGCFKQHLLPCTANSTMHSKQHEGTRRARCSGVVLAPRSLFVLELINRDIPEFTQLRTNDVLQCALRFL